MILRLVNSDENAQFIISFYENLRKKSSLITHTIADEFPKHFDGYMLMSADRTGDALTRVKRGFVNESVFSYSQLEKLVRVLKQYSPVSEIFCFYDSLYLDLDWQSRKDKGQLSESLVYKCSIEDMSELARMKENDFMPTYWWAEDRSWFFEHDMDSGYALIGGSWKLLDALREVTPVFVQILGSFPVKDIGRFYDLFEENFAKYYSKK